ncbi:MAG: LamG domain-containing protein [Leptolyngbyaceae cyanobacterium]
MSQPDPTMPIAPPLEQLETALNQVPDLKELRRVYVCHGEKEVRIFVEAYRPPDQQEWLPKLCAALQQVQLQTAYPVRVYGRKVDDLVPRWQVVLVSQSGTIWEPAPRSQQYLPKPINVSAILKDLPSDLSNLLASLRQQPWIQSVGPTLTQLAERFSAQTPAVKWGAIALSCGVMLATVTLCARPPGLPNAGLVEEEPSERVSDALQFDGEDDIAIATQPDLPDWSAEDGLTISLWVYPTDYGYYGRIVERSDNTSDDRLLLVVDHEEQGIRFSLSGNYAIGPGLNLNEWNHVAGVYGNEYIWVYINGSNQAKVPYSGEVSLTDSDLLIGNNREGDRPFSGYLADIQIWDRALRHLDIIRMTRGTPLPMETEGFGLSWNFDQDNPAASLRDQTRQLKLQPQTTRSRRTQDGPQIVSKP